MPGIKTFAGTPDSITDSKSDLRSPSESELASLVVPNTAKPFAPRSSNHRQ